LRDRRGFFQEEIKGTGGFKPPNKRESKKSKVKMEAVSCGQIV